MVIPNAELSLSRQTVKVCDFVIKGSDTMYRIYCRQGNRRRLQQEAESY